METYQLRIRLESDATFGRGDGLVGLVDQEVEHDECGLPFLRGRTLKGLLVEECANILYALEKQNPALARDYSRTAEKLFGRPGSGLDDHALLRVGDACLPKGLRQAIRSEVERGHLSRLDVLESLTDVRRQTAMDETGVPDEHSLRAARVILRGTPLVANLAFLRSPENGRRALALLAACVKAFRRAGTARNRGRGRLTATLRDGEGQDVTDQTFRHFEQEVGS